MSARDKIIATQLALTVNKLGTLISNNVEILKLFSCFPQEFKDLMDTADREARAILFPEKRKRNVSR